MLGFGVAWCRHGSRMPQGPDGPIERPELITAAVDLMTGGPLGCSDDGLPRYMSGADAARELADRNGITKRQADRYVAEARRRIADQFAEDLPTRAAALAAISMGVVVEGNRDRQWTAVNGAVRNLCTIYGIESKVAVKGGGLDALVEAIKANPGARDAEIEALEAKEREGASDGPDAG